MWIHVYGDHVARQSRDPSGLAGAIFRAASENTPPGVAPVVRDYTVEGPVRETIRRLCDTMAQRGAYWDHGVQPAFVFVVGAADSRAGGPPPLAFLNGLRMIEALCRDAGGQCLFVVPPPAPPETGAAKPLRGFAKGSRRWLARIGPIIATDPLLGPMTLLPTVPDAGWADPLTLRPDALYGLAQQIVTRLSA